MIAPLEQIAQSRTALSIPAGAEPVPLSPEEKIRLGQLLRTIERGLSTFLEVAASLQEIRSSRLYRETHPDFPSWCRETLGLARSSVDRLIRSGEVAKVLIDNGVELPSNMSEATIRPLASLPGPELQKAGWDLIQAASPACGPTEPVASKICRVIKNALADGPNGKRPHSREHPSRERPFVQAAQRLSAYQGFSPEIVTAHIAKLPSAWSVYAACGTLIERCRSVQEQLAQRFPELCQPTH